MTWIGDLNHPLSQHCLSWPKFWLSCLSHSLTWKTFNVIQSVLSFKQQFTDIIWQATLMENRKNCNVHLSLDTKNCVPLNISVCLYLCFSWMLFSGMSSRDASGNCIELLYSLNWQPTSHRSHLNIQCPSANIVRKHLHCHH